MSESISSVSATGVNEDILFECPFCRKSLQIDARGSGFMVECPDCHQSVQVPALSSSALVDNAERIELEQMLRQLNQRIEDLEKKRQADEHCLKRIGDEIVLIQAAIDRITEIVASRAP